MKKLCIIIPAYNEELRIARTLEQYARFFYEIRDKVQISTELLVVLNGCRDNTRGVVQSEQAKWPGIIKFLDLPQAGKGLAVKAGFAQALKWDNDLIGFVDADMSTQPQYFYDLVREIQRGGYGCVIASRYMPGAYIEPARPWYKRWGSKLIYENQVRILFGLNFYDYQCGAKLFTRAAVAAITPELTANRWEFDVELLYLCKKHGFAIKEIPTTWFDQTGSKLATFSQGLRMLGALMVLRLKHSPFKSWMRKS